MPFDIRCILPSSETEALVAGFEEREPPGKGPPLHAHPNQIEIFHVIEGRFLFKRGDETCELEAGGSIVIPKGAAHTFKNVGEEAGVLHFELLPPGKSEEFFQRLASEAEQIEDMGRFFADYDIELLGPPLP